MKFNDIQMFVSDGNYEVNMPIDHLERRIVEWQAEDNLQLDPDFQRGHVWSEEQQVAWMEYFLRGGKTGRTLYFNTPWWQDFDKKKYEYKDFVLVDGLQRMTAFLRFLRGELAIFGGRYIGDFEDRIRMAHASDNLRLNINNLKTKAEVLRWYIQMNDGGTPHTPEEIAKVRALLEGEKE